MGRMAWQALAKSAVFTGFSASTSEKAWVRPGRNVPPAELGVVTAAAAIQRAERNAQLNAGSLPRCTRGRAELQHARKTFEGFVQAMAKRMRPSAHQLICRL